MSLKEVGAMNPDESLTVVGRMLSKLPVDVSVGKILIMGTLFHQVLPDANFKYMRHIVIHFVEIKFLR